MRYASTIVIVIAAVAGIGYILFRQWRYEQQLSGEAKQQWRQQQELPIFFLTTLIIVGVATLARVNGILLFVGGILATSVLFGSPARQFYAHSQRETVPQRHRIAVYSICFLSFAFVVALLFGWLRLFDLL